MNSKNNPKKNVLITGGTRGIGFEFTKQFLKKGFFVVTASRTPFTSPELQQLKDQYDNRLIIQNLDVSEEESRQKIFEKLIEKINHLDILINNAGIASGNEKFRYRFGELNQVDLCRSLLVNAVAPLLITEKFFPLLAKSTNPIVVNISSNSGSITKKRGNGSTGYGYSSSKAALNMFTKMLSFELKEDKIIVVSFHPGWVKTTMLYCENAPLEARDSVQGMISIIESLELKDSGKFLDWQGNELPW